MKQTAVEWLCEQYHLKQDIEIVKQAKEMEKQQIIDAITQYEIKYNKVFSEQGILNVVNKAEQYYKEAFKNK
jgi:transcription termination factor Rho